ncbi:MAG: hypothetical protein ACYTGS_15535 [Planctomycetota bacterium]|jgi:hypothetical protein
MLAGLLYTATFIAPEQVRTNPTMMLWVLPLAASISVVYKATKLPEITARKFIKESAVLFGSIVVFAFVSMVVGLILAWLIVE